MLRLRILYRSALIGLTSLLVLLLSGHGVTADDQVLKQGQVQTLPTLQTRARPILRQTDPFYLGMLEGQFLTYAVENNWRTISVTRDSPRWVRWQLLPGGEAVYPLVVNPGTDPDHQPTYARGFVVQAYFQQDRLVGIHLIRDPEEMGFDVTQLRQLIRGWFPDNRVLLRYQILPEDPSRQVISAYLGEVPPAFVSDIGRTALPFCHAFFTPTSPTPLLLPGLEVPPQCLTEDVRLQEASLPPRFLGRFLGQSSD